MTSLMTVLFSGIDGEIVGEVSVLMLPYLRKSVRDLIDCGHSNVFHDLISGHFVKNKTF